MKGSYIELDFNVTHRAGANGRYADGDYVGSVDLGSIALFVKYRLTSSSGKEIEEIDNANVICLMYKLISNSRERLTVYQLVFIKVLKLEKKKKLFSKQLKGSII